MKKSLIMMTCLFLWQACGTGIQSTFPDEKAVLKRAGAFAPRLVDGQVEFTYVTKTKKNTVHVAGSFNHWKKTQYSMKQVQPGIWKARIPVPEGRCEYKFLANGSMWIADRNNPAKTDDGWGHSLILLEGNKLTFPTGRVSEQAPGYLYSQTRAYDSPDWIRDTVIYELFPRVYTKKGYQGLTGKLDHLAELGVDTLWIMPTFPIGKVKRKGSLGSPYAVKDYYKINPEFGTEADFREFVNAAHKRGMKVILDWVPNHSAWDNKLIKEHPEYYMKDKNGKITVPPETDWTDVAQFDYKNQAMRRYMLDALRYWVAEFDVDGYRMDVAGRVPHDFWNEVRKELGAVKPEVMLLAESEDARHHINGFDLTYSGAIKDITASIAKGSDKQYKFHKKYQMEKYSFPKGSLRMHWMENHDQVHALEIYGKHSIYPAAVIHLTMDGVPLIHQGQEFGDSRWQNWRSLFDPLQLEWEEFDEILFSHYKNLIALRKGSPAFTRGDFLLVENDREKVISYARVYQKQKFLVVVNLSPEKQVVRFNKLDLREAGMKLDRVDELITFDEAQGMRIHSALDMPLVLKAWQSVIIRME